MQFLDSSCADKNSTSTQRSPNVSAISCIASRAFRLQRCCQSAREKGALREAHVYAREQVNQAHKLIKYLWGRLLSARTSGTWNMGKIRLLSKYKTGVVYFREDIFCPTRKHTSITNFVVCSLAREMNKRELGCVPLGQGGAMRIYKGSQQGTPQLILNKVSAS